MRGITTKAAMLPLLLAVAQAGYAQSVYGTIAGNVTDSSQAAIVSARVVATNPETGFTRETLSNSVGVYSVPDVLPGAYTVEVSAPGFQTYKRTGVTVSVQTLTRVDVALSIGTTNETVTVSADAAELQTDRTDVRSDLTSHTLENAPVPIGRNYQMLFVTIPGASSADQRPLLRRQSHTFTSVHCQRWEHQQQRYARRRRRHAKLRRVRYDPIHSLDGSDRDCQRRHQFIRRRPVDQRRRGERDSQERDQLHSWLGFRRLLRQELAGLPVGRGPDETQTSVPAQPIRRH